MTRTPRPRTTYALLLVAAAFVASHWRGLPFGQRFAFCAVLYGAAGWLAISAGGLWALAWVVAGVLLVVGPAVWWLGKQFGIWGRKKN